MERGPGWPDGGAHLAWAVLVWSGLLLWVGCLGSGKVILPLVLSWVQSGVLNVVTNLRQFILKGSTASLAMLTDEYVHIVGRDSSELVVAAVALTGWNCSHPSCHSASKNNS